MLLDIIQDYLGLNVNVMISVWSKRVLNAFLPFVLGFYVEILEQQSRLFICDLNHMRLA